MLRVINLRNYKLSDNEILVRVDRKSVLGNIYILDKESEREMVCSMYKSYFDKITDFELTDEEVYDEGFTVDRKKFVKELYRIRLLSLDYDVALGCWCSPKECHAETIKYYLEVLKYGESYS